MEELSFNDLLLIIKDRNRKIRELEKKLGIDLISTIYKDLDKKEKEEKSCDNCRHYNNYE